MKLALLFALLLPMWLVAAPEVNIVGGPPPPTLPDTGTRMGVDTFNIYKKELQRLDAEITEIEAKSKKVVDFEIFKRTSDVELDFREKHEKMLSNLGTVISLCESLKQGLAEVSTLRKEFELAKKNDVTAEALPLITELSKDIPALEDRYKLKLADTLSYRESVNDALIEDVHRYQIRNGFRSFLGLFWVGAFLAITIGIFFLINKRILDPSQSSTLQVIAMILIIFVVLLFGICDVMGENGVTGLLAALAGYILGKSTSGKDGTSTKDLAEIIAATQGRNYQPASDKEELIDELKAKVEAAKALRDRLAAEKLAADNAYKANPSDSNLKQKAEDLATRWASAEKALKDAERLVTLATTSR